MAKRRSQSNQLFDDLRSIFKMTPWWVGPPIIVLTWVLFRYIAPTILTSIFQTQSDALSSNLVKLFSLLLIMFAPFIAFMATLVWIVALFDKYRDSQRLENQTGIESIRALSWRDFEHLLAEAFRRQGYSVQDTGSGADGGIDLILFKEGQETLVQAKQWRVYKVGVKIVRELFGVQNARKASQSILVTSGRFTDEARQFASENNIKLIDAQILEQMIAGVQKSGYIPLQPLTSTPDPSIAPNCPTCSSPMIRRTAKQGANAGKPFWGCSRFPACKGIRSIS